MTARLLPAIGSRDELAAALRDAGRWLPAVRAICARHHVPADGLEPLDGGSNLVAAAGNDRVVKLYSPRWPQWFESERAVLSLAHGQLGIATPEIVAEGELEDWRYLVLTRLRGVELHTVWRGRGRGN